MRRPAHRPPGGNPATWRFARFPTAPQRRRTAPAGPRRHRGDGTSSITHAAGLIVPDGRWAIRRTGGGSRRRLAHGLPRACMFRPGAFGRRLERFERPSGSSPADNTCPGAADPSAAPGRTHQQRTPATIPEPLHALFRSSQASGESRGGFARRSDPEHPRLARVRAAATARGRWTRLVKGLGIRWCCRLHPPCDVPSGGVRSRGGPGRRAKDRRDPPHPVHGRSGFVRARERAAAAEPPAPAGRQGKDQHAVRTPGRSRSPSPEPACRTSTRGRTGERPVRRTSP